MNEPLWGVGVIILLFARIHCLVMEEVVTLMVVVSSVIHQNLKGKKSYNLKEIKKKKLLYK